MRRLTTFDGKQHCCETPHYRNQHEVGCPATIISGLTLRDTPLLVLEPEEADGARAGVGADAGTQVLDELDLGPGSRLERER